MSFEHNNFLTGSISDADIAIQEILDTYFRKDGSIPMEGTFNAGKNSLFDIKNSTYEHTTQLIPSAGQLALYAKSDDHLYISTSGGVESQLSSGGDVDGPVSAVDNNLASYDGITGKIIKDAGILSTDVTIGAGSSTTGNVASFANGTGKLLLDSGKASGDLVVSSNWTTDEAITVTDTIGTNTVKQTGVILDTNNNFLKGAIRFIHEEATSLSVGSDSGASLASGALRNVFIGNSAGNATTTADDNTCVGYASYFFGEGKQNVCIGESALGGGTTMDSNIAIGYRSITSLLTGDNNICISPISGGSNYIGSESGNIILGNSSGNNAENNFMRLGNSTTVSTFITGIGNVTPSGTPEVMTMDPLTGECGTALVAADVVLNQGTATDNAICRFNSASGKIIQTSDLGVDDNGSITKSGTLFISELGSSNNLVMGTGSATLVAGANNSTIYGQLCAAAMTTEDNNCYYGSRCANASTGSNNCAYGRDAFDDASNTASSCSVYGAASGGNLTSGSNNNFYGISSGLNITSTSGNICIDNTGTAGDTSKIRIGTSQTTCHIAGIRLAVNTTGSKKHVIVDSSGQLIGTELSAPIGWIYGFDQVNTSTTVITYGTTSEDSLARSDDNTFDLTYNGTKTITLSTVGVGGITDTQDPSTADQAYEVYVIGDSTLVSPTATEILAVEEGTVITSVIEFTSGSFNEFRRIGWFRTLDGANTIIPHMVAGKGNIRQLHYNGDRTEQTVLFAGSSTTFVDMASGGQTTATYTAPGSSHIVMRIAFGTSSSSNDEAAWRENGSSLTIAQSPYTHSNGSALSAAELFDGQILVHLNRTDRITEYAVTAAANDLYCYVISFAFGL